MPNITGFVNIVEKIKTSLDNNKERDLILYAFNATGKTRLSYEFNITSEDEERIETLCYNSIVEDYFIWNNDTKTMTIDKNSWMFNFILDEGLENEIIENYSLFVDTKLEPNLDFSNGLVKFKKATGDDEAQDVIKISKGEETLFKWTVFYSVLKHALEILNDKEEDRSTDIFNKLKYIIIDDPVSSLDDFRIYTLSTQLLQIIEYVHEKQLHIPFLILTHHVLFYNIIVNTMKNRKEKFISYLLLKSDEDIELQELKNKEPITYHLEMLKNISKALKSNQLQKSHFNIFRSILEKLSVFLGYNNWQDLFKNYSSKKKFEKLINMNSHERYAELETKYLTQEQINAFTDGFYYFKENYKFNI